MRRISILLVLSLLFFFSCKSEDSPTAPATTPSSIGTLSISPNGILVSDDSKIQVTLTVPPEVVLADSTVRLVRLNSSNSEELAFLYDNGNLANGDEILGDNIYSAIVDIRENSIGEVSLQVLARIKGQTVDQKSETKILTVYSNLTSEEFDDIVKTQDEAADKLDQLMNNNINNFETAFNETVAWLKSNSKVGSVETDGSTSIRIKYSSGLHGGIIISKEDADGNIVTKGGFTVGDRKKNSKIPVYKQTRGSNEYYTSTKSTSINKVSDLDPQLIGNRNVLIYAPFEAAFGVDMRPTIETILKQSDYEFEVTSLINQDANVAAFYNATNYGLVIMDTHGSGGKEFGTGEVVDTNAAVYKSTYKAMLKAGKLAIWKNMSISITGSVKKKADIYAIRASFISSLAGKFPNSVIFNGSCESTMAQDLSDAFTGKGAKTYYGFDKVVNTTFCAQMSDTVVKRLAVDLMDTFDAWEAKSDPVAPKAAFDMDGELDIHYPSSLINGDFEFGKLDGWTKVGDGRVISQLGTQSPTGGKFMGIISTGLGYTTATGKIFQSFRIEKNQTTLIIKWNFLSEEFLEFINSQYQDYFRIYIKVKNGPENVLVSKTIDQIASDYGAKKFNQEDGEVPQPGNLVFVSPAVSFDVGDVYMTNWVTATYDISGYQDKVVTLVLEAGDVGDSIYDTAILLDDISVK
ncbi:Chitinase [hydrothermal vent metagenome]|uniref:Chitinase n=1 Tax=hydrothermal vent metagenome TaxID=652676 RepID=A0A3B1C8T9_9ZZZZ